MCFQGTYITKFPIFYDFTQKNNSLKHWETGYQEFYGATLHWALNNARGIYQLLLRGSITTAVPSGHERTFSVQLERTPQLAGRAGTFLTSNGEKGHWTYDISKSEITITFKDGIAKSSWIVCPIAEIIF